MNNIIKTLIISSSLLIGVQAAAEIKPINSIAVSVNATAITYGDVERVVNELKSNPDNQGIPMQTLLQNAKMTLIERALLVEAAQKMNIQVTPTQVANEIERLAKADNTSVENLYQQMKAKGISKDRFHLEVTKNLLIERMMQNLTDDITIKDEQIDQYIAKAKAEGQILPNGQPFTVYTIRRVLLNAKDQQSMPAVGQRINQIAQAVQQGTPFENVVQRHSQEATENGTLDISDGMLPTNAEALLHQMQLGQISPPIASGTTWQIFQLVNTRTEESPEKTQREAIRRMLLNQEQQKAQQQFIMQLQQHAVINEY